MVRKGVSLRDKYIAQTLLCISIVAIDPVLKPTFKRWYVIKLIFRVFSKNFVDFLSKIDGDIYMIILNNFVIMSRPLL